MDLWSGPERTYTDFASYAVGESATLEAWARGVAGDPAVHAWLERLPRPKQQPNLVFAAARWHGVPDDADYPTLREALLDDDGSIVSTVLTRATQTNEAGRTATLLPALMSLPGVADGEPVALVEAGASGGLCLWFRLSPSLLLEFFLCCLGFGEYLLAPSFCLGLLALSFLAFRFRFQLFSLCFYSLTFLFFKFCLGFGERLLLFGFRFRLLTLSFLTLY